MTSKRFNSAELVPRAAASLLLGAALLLMGARWCQAEERPPVAEKTPVAEKASVTERAAVAEKAPLAVIQKPIFSQQRLALTEDYSRIHYGRSTWRLDKPQMIVIHYTAFPSLAESYGFFAPALLFSRDDIRSGGAVNVSAHFLVDKDGTVYQLAPEDVICRHTIGFNDVALGIENVGEGAHALTDAQLKADAALVAELVSRHPSIRYLIGHYEYQDRTLPHYALRTELDPDYKPTVKRDPGPLFMARLREILQKRFSLKLER